MLLLLLLSPLQWLPLQQAGLAGGTILFRRLKLPVRHVDLPFSPARNTTCYDCEQPQLPTHAFFLPQTAHWLTAIRTDLGRKDDLSAPVTCRARYAAVS
jgi:hypothetical protein